MTEEEAKTKICPQTFGWECTETRDILHSDNCVGSECAAWKWKMTPKDAAMLNKIGKEQEPQGYCGLARGE